MLPILINPHYRPDKSQLILYISARRKTPRLHARTLWHGIVKNWLKPSVTVRVITLKPIETQWTNVWCWSPVFDAGPTLNQHLFNVSLLLGRWTDWRCTAAGVLPFTMFAQLSTVPQQHHHSQSIPAIVIAACKLYSCFVLRAHKENNGGGTLFGKQPHSHGTRARCGFNVGPTLKQYRVVFPGFLRTVRKSVTPLTASLTLTSGAK